MNLFSRVRIHCHPFCKHHNRPLHLTASISKWTAI